MAVRVAARRVSPASRRTSPARALPGRMSAVLASAMFASAMFASACGTKDSTNPLLSAPAKLIVVSGDGQAAIGPVKLGTPLTLKVTDVEDRPVAGVILAWSTSDPLSNLTTLTDTTDATGQATNNWTLGPTPGRQSVKVTSTRIAGASAVFQALNGVATVLTTVSGDNQVGDVGATLAAPLVVKLTDAAGNPSVGATVTWTATGGGTVTPATSLSDATGQATAQFRLSTSPGPQSVVASTVGPPSTRTVFSASNGATISGFVTVTRNQTWSIGDATPAAIALTAALHKSAISAASAGGAFNLRSVLGSQSLSASARLARWKQAVARLNASRAVQRLIVTFAPSAVGLSAHLASTASGVQRSLSLMQRVVSAQKAAGVVTLAEPSPVVMATRVTVAKGVSVIDAMAAFANDPSVESVTIDSIFPMIEHDATPMPFSLAQVIGATAFHGPTTQAFAGAVPGTLPNNPGLLQQLWSLNLIDAPRAWNTVTGSTNVLVAVVDQGARFDHPALASVFTTDGYNFVSGGDGLMSPEPVCQGGTTLLPEAGPGPDATQPDDLTDTGTCWDRGTIGAHGVHVAGIIGAKGNSGVGTTGVNWNVKIRPVRAFDVTGSASYFDMAQAILYAAGLPASNGSGTTVTAPSRASIINMSFGAPSTQSTFANAVTAAGNAGSLLVASAGNNEDNLPSYPAAYPGVLSVTALGPDVQLAGYTTIGTTVSFSAPGGEFRYGAGGGVLSTTWDFTKTLPTYAYYEGTSMAAPQVTGVAALALAANPTLTSTQLRTLLQNTAIDIGAPGRDDRYGYGIINAYNAINNVTGPTRATFVRLVNAQTGDTVSTLQARADGSFSFTRLAAGSYYVVGGRDEGGDRRIGVPGRAFGWFGPATGPTAIALGATQQATAAIVAGAPLESEPNNTIAQANKLLVNTFVMGVLAAGDTVDAYSVQIPKAGTYYFETGGVLGTCGSGLELDTVLTLTDLTGVTISRNDDSVFPGSQLCSAIGASLSAGSYIVRVSGRRSTSFGQYRLWVRDQP